MKRLVCAVTVVVGIAVVAAALPSVQEPKWKSTRPINDLPNPYKRDANWAQLPTGLKWGAVIGAEPGPDGNIYVVHRCFENSCAGRTEPSKATARRAGCTSRPT
jgi:hypothetical protein